MSDQRLPRDSNFTTVGYLKERRKVTRQPSSTHPLFCRSSPPFSRRSRTAATSTTMASSSVVRHGRGHHDGSCYSSSTSFSSCHSSCVSETAWELLQQRRRLLHTYPFLLGVPPPPALSSHASSSSSSSAAAPSRNDWLRLPPGLHELAGTAGAGKTQLALSLSADLVLLQLEQQQEQQDSSTRTIASCDTRNSNTSINPQPIVLYVSSTKSGTNMAAGRLAQILQRRGKTQSETTDLLRRVGVRDVPNLDALIDLVETLIGNTTCTGAAATCSATATVPPPTPTPLPSAPRLLVLDSVADLIRGEEVAGWATAARLRQLAGRLRQYGIQCHTVVLSLNHVVSTMGRPTISAPSQQPPAPLLLHPALGLSWAQGMDRSYFVARSSVGTCCFRTLELRRASDYGTCVAHFDVRDSGVHRLLACTGTTTREQPESTEVASSR